ncbi:MAG: glycine--tRNA ligase [Candidatus Peribacteraceae bacterium]|nr:glycine--tRNA ligase [Candidatus Peribacteraceae bacterium]
MPASSLDSVVSLCKRRGFIFPGSDIYGGLANSWDYGPLGTDMKNAIRDWWWDRFVRQRRDMVGLDAAIMMNPKVWEASGHVANFNDAMVDCKKCKARHRADHLIENAYPDIAVEGKTPAELTAVIREKQIACPSCGDKTQLTDARKFNLLFQTHMGAILSDQSEAIYLRGEIAQAMFVNFKNVLGTTRKRLPFGIASVGKAFRNEITPGNFTFRTLEFDLMEFEYFVRAEEWETVFKYWLDEQLAWVKEMGFSADRIRTRDHSQDELAHYSKKSTDVEYHTPFGWKEMFGLAYRTDFDLKNHMEKSGEDLQYTDPDDAKIKFIPHVIEPTFGLSRLTLMTLLEAYEEQKLEGDDTRTVLHLHPRIAPVQVAILPLSKKENLIAKAQELYNKIIHETNLRADFDVTGSIGKRYRRQDEIGTPKCITVDFGTIGEDAAQGERDTVTIRDRDTLKQERVPLSLLMEKLKKAS